MLGKKLLSENYLRMSGLNYTIIRPGNMTGSHFLTRGEFEFERDEI